MNNNNISDKEQKINYNRTLIILIVILAAITAIYQLRPFLDDSQFAWISVPTFSIIPGFLIVYSLILTKKLFRQKHFQAKAFLLFTLATACWFIAEQIWQAYDHVWIGEPFPSEADIFYLATYPLVISFLFISLRPILRSIHRNVWLLALGLSFSFLIPSILVSYDDMQGEEVFATSIALTYPILASIQLIPAIIGILYLSKKNLNFFWLLILFGFIIYNISDTFFLFSVIDDSYYDGHPTDLMYTYGYVMFIFAIHVRMKAAKSNQNIKSFFSENVQFDTINKFGIPLTLAIIIMIVSISLIHELFFQIDEQISTQNILFGIVTLSAVFVIMVLAINKNLSHLVKIKTRDLVEQKDNLEYMVEEKTQEVLKSERLSAIGELAGRLSHDLRNPLSVIKNDMDMIELKDGKFEKKSIDRIQRAINRMDHQIESVMDFVRQSPLNFGYFRLSYILKSVSDMITVPSNIKINFPKNDTQIWCDEQKSEILFYNLIINSIQEISNNDGYITIRLKENKKNIEIEIEDSGNLPIDNLNKIFDPLFTTKQSGTGLGLASCKNILEQMGGKLLVQTNPTVFTMIFPRKN